MGKRWRRLLMAVLALPALAIAQQGQRAHNDGDYSIHYNALPTTALAADVAGAYGIVRSSSRGLVNVAVLRRRPGQDEPVAVAATVTGSVRNLLGQQNPLPMREVREQDAIYYLGEFRIRGEERLRFDLQVTPEGAGRAIPVRFEHDFIGG